MNKRQREVKKVLNQFLEYGCIAVLEHKKTKKRVYIIDVDGVRVPFKYYTLRKVIRMAIKECM